MALPYIFANSAGGNVPASELDTNYNSVAAMAITQCTATGTNTIALTQTANQPTISAYANYLQFGFVAAASSTGSVQVNVNGIGALNLYTISGSQAGSGTINSGSYYVIVYNSALNTGSGGFQIIGSTATTTTSVINNYITGFLSTSQTFTSNTSATQTITSGYAADSTNTNMLSGGSFSWNIANGNAANGYQGGTTLPNSSTIHFYVITNSSNGSPASFASTSLTPTLPAGYTSGFYRRIFSLNTNSSGVLLAGTMREVWGGGARYFLATAVVDTSAAINSTNRTLVTLTGLPTGIQTDVMYNFSSNASSLTMKITSPDEPDVAVGTGQPTTGPFYDWQNQTTTNIQAPRSGELMTNTSGQVGVRSSSSSSLSCWFSQHGYTDHRRS